MISQRYNTGNFVNLTPYTQEIERGWCWREESEENMTRQKRHYVLTWYLQAEAGTLGWDKLTLKKPVSSDDTAVHSHTNPIYLPLEYLEGPLPQSPLPRKTPPPQLSSYTHTQMYTGSPLTIIQPQPHSCTILARLNHSLMGGLTDRYCYSLWGLAVHTNRRLRRSCCQQRRSGYLHAYNGQEWNATGGDLPCPLSSSECHNMGGWGKWGSSGGCLQSVRNHDPRVTSNMHKTFPWGAACPKTCSALVR